MSVSLPEHGIDVVEAGRPARRHRIRCAIDENLRFDTKALAAYCLARWDATVYDAFVVAAAVQFCDQVVRRPSTSWGRSIVLRVPVHDPDRWESRNVSRALHDALGILTGDRWRVGFVQRRKRPVAARKQPLDMPGGAYIVMPFSDGLDSYMVAAILERKYGDALVRIRLGSRSLPARRTRTSSVRAFALMSWRVSYRDSRSVETSARARGFRFTLLSGIAAFLCRSQRIALSESGQGALGPTLVPVGQTHPDVRSHPLFTDRMSAFVSALFDYEIQYEHPRLWHTKGQTLTEFHESCTDDADWMGTRSCWQGARKVSVGGRRRQCGICAACLLRRMSVHAAGRCEAPEAYVWEDLSAARFEDGAARAFKNREPRGALHEYAIAGVLHLDHLASLRQSAVNSATLKKQVFLLSRSLELGKQDTWTKLEGMLRRHEEEWSGFVDSLGPRSFVAQWIARGH